MMTDVEFEIWCAKNGVNEPTKRAIQRIRHGKPSRSVRSGPGHVSGKFASRKMGLTIQYESGTLELPTLYEFERNEAILEFWDQPSSLQISYVRENGKRDSFTHYPDFFVIRENQCGFVECKYHKKLLQLSKQHPERYVFDGNRWHSSPCEEEARRFGFTYEIRTEMDLDMTLYQNILYLSNYEKYSPSEESRRSIIETVQNEPGITLFYLVRRHNPDDVNKLILTGELYADLYQYRLSNPDFVPIYPDQFTAQTLGMLRQSKSSPIHYSSPITLEVNSRITWNRRIWTIANVGMSQITLIDPNSDDLISLSKSQFESLVHQGIVEGVTMSDDEAQKRAEELVKCASPKDREEANYRARQVERFLAHDTSVLQDVPERTLRDWVKKYKLAQQMYGFGYLGLLSRHERKGRRDQRLDPALVKKMDDYIAEHYENPTRETRKSIYGRFYNACLEDGLKPPSFKSFLRAIKKRSGYLQALRREGRRSAYQGKHPYLTQVSLAEASRPFQSAHCDHTPLDIIVVDSQTGLSLGTPWLTCLIDDCSRRVLGSYISFEPPSATSCLMALRDCIRRYHRLPKQIVVDNGKEFHSKAFQTFLAAFGIHPMYRPPAEPRYGNRIERYFHTINTQFLYNLKGNTQASKTPRQLTKAVDPRRNAVWTLRALRERLEEYMYEIYDTCVHSSLGYSPREFFESRMSITGERPHELIAYTPAIDMLTLPPTPKGKLKVQQAGVKFQRRYYWHPVFSESDVYGTSVPVVYDPYDAGVVYAYCKKQWYKCLCRQSEFHGRSLKELEIVSAEYRKKYKLGANQAESSAKLARFINEIKEVDEYKLQVARDRAMRECYSEKQSGDVPSEVIPLQRGHSVEISETPVVTAWKPKKKERY